MPRNCEASIKCLQSKAYSYSLQYNGNYIEGLPELRNVINFQQRGGIVEQEPNVSLSSESPNKGYHIHQQDFCTWSAFHPNFQKLPNQWNAFDSQFYAMNLDYPFPVDHQYPYMPWKIFPHGHPNEFQFQEFQYFVVIDFEATCDKERTPHPQEIIEFPSVIVNSMTGEQEAIFQTYVRPTCNQLLTDFCKDLTGIQQIQVDRGVTLSEALLMHDKWLESKGIKHTNFAVVTWSNWDCRVMLESECRFKRIRKPPYFNKWINLKVPFHEVFGGVRCNLKEAVQLAGLAWEGRAHCGLDDAMNTARLLTLLMRRGFRFAITNSLIWQQSAECPLAWQQSSERPSVPTHHPCKLKQPLMPLIQFHPAHTDLSKERRMYCYCGVKSSKRMVRKPGPKHGSFFFGCGNWTATRGAQCPYFEWASS